MTLKTHFETGIGLSLLLGGMLIQKIYFMDISSASKIGILGAILIGVTAGSVYPDFDRDESNLNEKDLNLRWENKLDHRGVVHTLINAVGVALPFLLLDFMLSKVTSLDLTWIAILGLSMSVGCIWHMILDSLTPDGIMWLYPITRYRFRIPLIKNSATERLFRILVTGAFIYGAVFYWTLHP
ncbi:MAG: metal-dependent hydrolase [Mobilitalea sp.]